VAPESEASASKDALAILQRLAVRAGIPTPRLDILDSNQPGAFAIGVWPFGSRVIISTGLCSLLTREELTAVLAHETAHIKKRHTLLMIAVTAVSAVMILIAGVIALLGYSLRRHGGLLLTALGVVIAVAALIFRSAVARYCEFEADYLAGCLCGHPEWLASALNQVWRYQFPTKSRSY
jgi:heat shock protein HtpX